MLYVTAGWAELPARLTLHQLTREYFDRIFRDPIIVYFFAPLYRGGSILMVARTQSLGANCTYCATRPSQAPPSE